MQHTLAIRVDCMHDDVTVLWSDVIVGVTCSMTDAINVNEMASHSEQDARKRKDGKGRYVGW